MSCCIDAFRTMILASKDGTGCDHYHFGLQPPRIPCRSALLVVAAVSPHAPVPVRPPPDLLAVVLQL